MSARVLGRLAQVSLMASLSFSAAGCGASSWVVAEHSEYPISMSNGLRDERGKLLPQDRKVKVGDFKMRYKACSMLWRFVSFTGDKDISESVDTQVKAKGGDAVTNLTVSSGGTVWNFFTLVGLVPDCSSVRIAGDIVKVTAAAPAGAAAVPSAEKPAATETPAPPAATEAPVLPSSASPSTPDGAPGAPL